MKMIPALFFGIAMQLPAANFVVPCCAGDAASSFPFSWDSMRYQQVYDASAFSSLTPVGGGWITALAFRVERGSPPLVANAQINLSTSARPIDGLSTVFSENIGTDNRMVVTGNLNFTGDPSNTPLPSVIPLTTPFFYNPAAGNLLMDVRMEVGLGFGGGTELVEFDASTPAGDSTSIVLAFDRDDLVGVVDTSGLITGFQVTPVPEPSITALVFAALVTAFVFSLRQKQPNRKE